MKYLYLLILFFSNNYINSQNSKFSSNDFFEKFAKAYINRYYHSAFEYYPGSTAKNIIFGKNKETLRVELNFLKKSYYYKENLKKESCEILYQDGLPIIVNMSSFIYENPLEFSDEFRSYFTINEQNKINKFNSDFRKKMRMSNKSYLDIIKKWKTLTKYNMQDKLGTYNQIWHTETTEQEWVQITADRDILVDKKKTIGHSQQYYQNISKNTIMIPGIERVLNNHQYIYNDVSIFLEPGESTPEISINDCFYDNSTDDIQYYGISGKIKILN